MAPFSGGLAAGESGDDPLPGNPLADLGVERHLRALGERSLAPSTRRHYRAQLEYFHRTMSTLGLSLQYTVGKVQAFVVWAKSQGKSHSWVCGHLAAVRHDTRLRGGEDPTNSFLVRAALKGWARDEPRTPDSRSPIDFPTLQAIIDVLGRVTSSPF